MRRIYEPQAYAARTGCYWDEFVDPVDALPLAGNTTCDVAVVGAGYTGLSAAFHLAKAGCDVVVLEERDPGFGASGRNGGFCCLGGAKLTHAQIARKFGEGAAADWALAERVAVQLVADLIAEHGMKVDLHSNGETIMAHSPRAFRKLAQTATGVRRSYGVDPAVIAPSDLASHGLAGKFFGALTIPIGFGLNPAKYLNGLQRITLAAGARLHPFSAVRRLETSGAGFRAYTDNGIVCAKKVILATNGYSSDDVPDWLRARYMPAQSQVLVTAPLTKQQQSSQGWFSDQMAYDHRHLLHYFRKLPNNRFLFGMRGGVSAKPNSMRYSQRQTQLHFHRLFQQWRDVPVTHSWSGLVCLLPSLVPFDLPLNFHPAATGVRLVFTPIGAG
ncbi:Gamma-glutamylputrescine oxidoreductase [Pseudoprimorskyibacter insulae]|uniref:Gamma-glutamylputrescine oxidoreductase n=1 Tax=Pseudoprimorskyibacter insulae TaxID=1695997 RepID=A0A2R8ATL7_9RHOB|nr:Gamma-glutamylputrescine oxidoreductase [Pseudoprimorskyibacter insulae]